MTLSGNRGEWSEIYTFLRLLADGKLFAADEHLNRIEEMFFPIIKIIREEIRGQEYEYYPRPDDSVIEIYLNDELVDTKPAIDFDAKSSDLYKAISDQPPGKGAFKIPISENFIRSIYVNKLAAAASSKSDIDIKLHDVNTGYEHIAGFSIKSEMGMPSTLLNASGATNFIFRVDGLDHASIDRINEISTASKIRDRISEINRLDGKLTYVGMQNNIFLENLIMIDSHMPQIVATMLLEYYSGHASDSVDIVKQVIGINPIDQFPRFYEHKAKDMLCSFALGMRPATKWDGTDEASGGYIIVKASGEVLAYHVYNRDAFRKYLLEKTKFETASSRRHAFGTLYRHDSETRIKLNLQIRFK
jgi:hypothetical protein